MYPLNIAMLFPCYYSFEQLRFNYSLKQKKILISLDVSMSSLNAYSQPVACVIPYIMFIRYLIRELMVHCTMKFAQFKTKINIIRIIRQ